MIKSTSLEKFTIYTDDNAYLTLINSFLTKEIPNQVLTDKTNRAVWLIEINNTKYIIKWHVQNIRQLHEKAKYFFKGSYYPNLQKRIEKAKKNGCDIVGSIYLVAEYKQKDQIETYLLLEYIEGKPLQEYSNNYDQYKDDIKKCITQLHLYGLASSDLNPYNILVTKDNNLKIIDLSDNGIFAIAKMKDARHLKRFYDIEFEEYKGFLYYFVETRDKLIKFSRKIRNKK